MKNYYLLFRKLLLLAWCCALLFSFSNVQAQSIDKLEQYANGALKDVTFSPTTNTGWVTGNVNAAKAHYACGMTIPYRLQVSGLTSGVTYRVKIGFDITKDFKHAIDFMTSFERPDLHSATFGHTPENVIGDVLVDTDLELSGLDPFNDFGSFPIPPPNNSIPTSIGLSGPIDGFNDVVGDGYGLMKIYNGTVTAMQFVGGDPSANTSSDYYWVDFTPNPGETIVLLAWGGHIACEDLWGPGSSAADINGSPYHMFIADCEMLSGCGSKEVQLSATAVIAYTAPTCEVIATDVECFGDSTGSLDIAVGGEGTAPYWIYVFEDSDPGTPVYEGATDGSGNYSVGGLPAGPYTIYTWNEEQNVGLEDPSECRDTIFQAEECTVTITPPAGYDLGCNGTWPTSLTADVLVDCGNDGSTNTTVDSDEGVLQAPQGCVQSRLYTFTYTDDCGNTDTKTTTLTMKVDLTAPEITANSDDDLGCNPTDAEIETALGSASATDNCDDPGDITITSRDETGGEPCAMWAVRTFYAEDLCGNIDSAKVRVDWKVDLTAPEITANSDDDLGCNPTDAEIETALGSASATDNCDDPGDITITSRDETGGEPCAMWAVRTFYAEDLCGNIDSAKVRVDWKVDLTAPEIDSIPFMDSICNMEPADMIWAYWTDNCDGSDSVSATAIYVEGECPAIYSYTFHIEDDCGNPTDTTVYVKKWTEQVGNCETVFGVIPNDDEVVDFCSDGIFNRWGWTNPITKRDTTYVLDLYAGAAHCDTTDRTPVGKVEVRWQNDSVYVDYIMDPGNYLEEVHVYVGYEKYPVMGNGKKQKQTVAPGQYTVVVEGEGHYTDANVIITNVVDEFWIIAHGVACELTCVCYGEVDVNNDGVFVLSGSDSIVSPDDYPWWEEMDPEDLPPFKGSKRANGSVEDQKVKKSADIQLDVNPILQDSELKVFPNPFDEVVNFEFVSAVSGHAVLEIHNMLGQRVARILDQPVEAGELQRVEFRPNSEISGVYLYRLDIDGDTRIGKIIYRNK
ncbi:T9SS type A sorting domain-containing protein [Draconibacterium mangrovi]|uniref:T9SS type A sorting domain-containing protein n=1 Tax=Draconibacterium mangrovi TaxID=2697469 RepID=UPI0013D7EC02|nr:T9SS type A sorting domain-containing protein [Draconibacterium mangrovi]